MIEQRVDKKILEKWAPVIDGTGEWKDFVQECPKVTESFRPILAQSLENIAHDLKESTNADAVGDYKPILIPMIRRILPAQIGPKIFGTFAMKAPQEQIFGIRSVYQNTTAYPTTYSASVLLTLASVTGFTVGGDITGDSDNGNDGVGVVRYIEDNYVLVEVTSGTFVTGNGVDNANPYSADATTISAVNVNEALYSVILKDYSGPYSTAVGEALSSNMHELGGKIFTSTITAENHKLKMKWTEELEDDMRALHGLNAEAILTQMATDEINLEFNQTHIEKARTAAIAGGTTPYDYSTADGTWEVEKYMNLKATINRVKYQMAGSNKRGMATWAIVSPSVLSALDTIGMDTSGVDPVVNTYMGKSMGMDIFCDIYASSNDIILGYKGNMEADSGIFWGIYQPITVRKGYGEEDGQPRSIFRTRTGYADHIFGSENYFRRITCANMP